MPRKSSTASKKARVAARKGTKYTTALRYYADGGLSVRPHPDSLTGARESVSPQGIADGLTPADKLMADIGISPGTLKWATDAAACTTTIRKYGYQLGVYFLKTH